jgi:ATP-binding cassette, subfamily B, bacterial PglK
MDGTLCENIAFGISASEINRSHILQIIDGLGMNDLVRQLPKGIDSKIGERGSKLSGGQRQRIAVARALYANAEIIILDEATNQVQASLESQIMDLLHKISNDKKTVIMVTHKVQAGFFDTVYYLENGKLVDMSEINTKDSPLTLH